MLTSWRNTNPEIPATNSARKTSDRNMAYYREREGGEICIVCIKTLCLRSVIYLCTHTHTHTHTQTHT